MKTTDKPILYHGIPIDGRMPLFRADMRQAIRDDRKGQTRRLNGLEEINEDPGTWQFVGLDEHKATFTIPGFATREIKLPWHSGDVRCMCEPLMRIDEVACYQDDYAGYFGKPAISLITGKPIPWRWERDYLASIHMPTEAARTVCKITDIRAEKLQEIEREDVYAEGIHGPGPVVVEVFMLCTGQPTLESAEAKYLVDEFSGLWDSINAKRGYSWKSNPFVWVISFKRVDQALTTKAG